MNGPITVQVYPFRSDAEIAVARLAADGIVGAIRDDAEGGLNPGFFSDYGVRVEVDSADLEDAFESLGVERLMLPRPIADAMVAHSLWAHPEEACGLVAFDDDGLSRMVFCLTNAEAAADRFTIDPAEHHGALRYAELQGWHIGAVFHSHVSSEPYPSGSDVDGGADPDWIHIIVGPIAAGSAVLRAFRIVEGSVSELSVTTGT